MCLVWVESRAAYPLVPLKDLSREIILILVAIGAGWSSFGIWICEPTGWNVRAWLSWQLIYY